MRLVKKSLRRVLFLNFLLVAFLATSVFFSASAAEARGKSFISASMLYQYCNSKYDVDYGYCAGFVGAIAEMMHDQALGEYKACGFKTVRAQQLIDIFKNFASQNKSMFNEDAKIMVAASIARAFPCQE